jgi:pimeloyl-ACP methyl ester carboxylesterase
VRPLLVLVHGAWASSWVWDPVLPELRARGFDVVAPDMPDAAEPEELSTLDEHVARIVAAIGAHAGPVLLVGHSGGGIPVTAAGERLAGRIAGAVFVAGIMLPSGVGFDALRAEVTDDPGMLGAAPFVEPALGGRGTVVPPDAAVALLFQNAAPADAVAAARRLQPQWNAGLDLVPTWTAGGFGSLPRLYVEATADRDIPLGIQRHMQRRSPGARVVTLDSDHAPQLSAPAELVAAITAFAAAV